jgi:hypothetical protein
MLLSNKERGIFYPLLTALQMIASIFSFDSRSVSLAAPFCEPAKDLLFAKDVSSQYGLLFFLPSLWRSVAGASSSWARLLSQSMRARSPATLRILAAACR